MPTRDLRSNRILARCFLRLVPLWGFILIFAGVVLAHDAGVTRRPGTLRESFDRKLVLHSLPMWTMTAADLATTEYAIGTGRFREANPLMRNRTVRIAVQPAVNVGTMFLSAYLRKRGVRAWWLPMHLVATGHSVGFSINLARLRAR